MTPKEKAKELIDAMLGFKDEYHQYLVIKCALIAVDEIIKQNVSTHTDYGASWTYWMQVKQEIEKL